MLKGDHGYNFNFKTVRVTCTYPSIILLVSVFKVDDPVTEGFECLGGEPAPDGWYLAVKQGPGDVVKLTRHTHFSSQCLKYSQTYLYMY